jgi:3-oxoacyl-[acyl-carrier protein] reductase
MKDLAGKVAVITGGGSGIGKELAVQLAQKGTKVVIASTNDEKLQSAVEEIKNAGGKDVLAVKTDVSKRDQVVNLHDQAVKAFGAVDILVCNAGVTTSGPCKSQPPYSVLCMQLMLVDDQHREQDWAWVYDVVLHGTAYCVQVFYPEMVRRKTGHIVMVGSQAGLVPNWFTLHGPYTSAKSAVMALGAALRPEAEEHNIGVSNVIVAGTVTEIMKSERSRPSEYGEPLVYNMPKRTARRIPASDTAGMIVKGIEENKPWIATHPELKELTRYVTFIITEICAQKLMQVHSKYFDDILASYDH